MGSIIDKPQIERLSKSPHVAALMLFLIALLFAGCGASNDGERPVTYIGRVISKGQQPIEGLALYIFETAESSTTDSKGEFFLYSFRYFGSIGIFVQDQDFSNTIRINDIPESSNVVELLLRFDSGTGELELVSTGFSSTPASAPTASADKPDSPDTAPSPLPEETPAEKPGNFDSNGNTSKFGIPDGLSGNIQRGRAIWSRSCSTCHVREKSGRSYSALSSSFKRIPLMKNLGISSKQMADLVAYLNRGSM